MTLDNLLALTIPYSLGHNQFTIDLISMNNVNGKLYYETLINQNVQKKCKPVSTLITPYCIPRVNGYRPVKNAALDGVQTSCT